jgi:sugar phosphate isomerase/epimerase
MKVLSRRRFVAGGAAAAGSSAIAHRLRGAIPGMPAGCQIFGVRKQLVADFDGTLKQLHHIGYRVIEFCSPPGFTWPKAGLAPLMKLSAGEIRRRTGDAGLRMVSCHYQYRELMEHIDERIEFANELGLEHMVVATIGRPETLDGWRERADDLNMLGEKARDGGLQLGFHNHGHEFIRVEGALVFDELMSRFDRKLVKSQFQVSILGKGVSPSTVLKKYPGRFLSLHLQDCFADSEGSVAVGQGEIDWSELFAAARGSNSKYYFVELDMDGLKASFPYLRDLEIS